MTIFNPWVILGFVLSLISAFGGGYFKGHHDEYLAQQAEIAKLNEQSREVERKLAEDVNFLSYKLSKANSDAKITINKLQSDVADGIVRLRVKTSGPVCTAPNPAAPAGDRREETAELDRSTAQSLVAITADGDAAIRQLNACIDAYNQVRSRK